MYDFALFLHLLGVATLFAAVGMEVSSLLRARSARDLASLRNAVVNAPVVGRLIPVAIVLLVGAGLYMLSQGGDTGTEFSWGTAWIDVAMGIVATLLVIGPAINGKRLEGLHKAAHAAQGNAIDATLDRMRYDRLMHAGIWYANVETVALLFLMTNKPSLAVSVTVAVAAAVASVVPTLLSIRRPTVAAIPAQASPPAAEELARRIDVVDSRDSSAQR